MGTTRTDRVATKPHEQEAKYIEEKDALDYVAGYCVVNDLSERHFQIERGGQWTKGKSAETFNPAGPWLAKSNNRTGTGGLSFFAKLDGSPAAIYASFLAGHEDQSRAGTVASVSFGANAPGLGPP